MVVTEKVLTLPAWVGDFLGSKPIIVPFLEERMRLVIALARLNVERGTGGPFGAAIFERDTGKLVAVGVNRVVPCQASVAHAEMMAFTLAQAARGQFDLAAPGLPAHELVTSAQMCAMCYGATLWSGVRRVVYGATAADVEELAGFDEGPLPTDWQGHLRMRGIEVEGELLRAESREVLALYRQMGGPVYNPGLGGRTDVDEGSVRGEGRGRVHGRNREHGPGREETEG